MRVDNSSLQRSSFVIGINVVIHVNLVKPSPNVLLSMFTPIDNELIDKLCLRCFHAILFAGLVFHPPIFGMDTEPWHESRSHFEVSL